MHTLFIYTLKDKQWINAIRQIITFLTKLYVKKYLLNPSQLCLRTEID